LDLKRFFDYRLRIMYLPRFRQCRSQMHKRQEPGVGDLTGLSAKRDGLIVATELA
jgi:hypothetical protein